MRPALLRRAALTVVTGGLLLAPAGVAVAQTPATATATATATAHEERAAADRPAEGPNRYFLLAGGAMTAAGAGGLVYASVRRGRSDQ
ncbi:hypothetical protein [Streptomyces xanthii]|uniref:Tat pathway signal sequence domain protein n=1 Tax=Streptomyces xanthii TaxID=2768069 RepID=A0A7H1B5X9_9ACTN|nr:hypothetical protein [Streptomyces xanthii]QNS04134.1 hypothetical protein IAG42_11190 [Streptomyces xanthii]